LSLKASYGRAGVEPWQCSVGVSTICFVCSQIMTQYFTHLTTNTWLCVYRFQWQSCGKYFSEYQRKWTDLKIGLKSCH